MRRCIFRDILGVGPYDQVAFLSDGERVEVVAIPEDPLTLGSKEEFLVRVARADEAYEKGTVKDSREVMSALRDKYGRA